MKNEKYLILNCDDFGVCACYNQAIIELLEAGVVSSATVISPAGHFEEAARWAAAHPAHSVGLHSCFTCGREQENGGWAPLTSSPSLRRENGLMHRNNKQAELHITDEAFEEEFAAQLQRCYDHNIPVTHVDNHTGSAYGLETGRELISLIFKQIANKGLPFRLPRLRYGESCDDRIPPQLAEMLRPLVAFADAHDIFIPDCLIEHPYSPAAGMNYERFRDMMIRRITNIPENMIVETYIHPAVPGREYGITYDESSQRVWEHKLFLDPLCREAFEQAGVQLITYQQAQALRKAGKV